MKYISSGCLWMLAGLMTSGMNLGYADRGLGQEPLRLQLRTRQETAPGSGRFHVVWRSAEWDARRTAIIVCDMWDDHYCRAAAARVNEMAPRMNLVLQRARERGVLIIHCPSGCMDHYADTPQRKLAKAAPAVETRIALESWCHLDPDREADLPIDDSEPCDDEHPRERVRFYTKQNQALKIEPGDAITDSAEAYYLMRQRGIDQVIIMGVHTNMCVLGRPFGIRQLVRQGMNVVLMRDMTDSMYNPKMKPFVSHFTGTDLVVEHIERFWCPTITSADVLGGQPFRFAADQRPHLVMVMAEDEYRTSETLPDFALAHLGHDFKVSCVFASANDRNDLPGLEVISTADLLLLSVRRRPLPPDQLGIIRKYIAQGKPLLALRTSSHAFALRDQPPPDGLVEWPEFDREVLGGYYQNHHGNELKTIVKVVAAAEEHPIVAGLPRDEFNVFGSLYRSSPLSGSATPLMTGRAEDVTPHEPVAWTNNSPSGGRVFYTSLGHPEDFKLPAFQRLLKNAVYWAADRPAPQTGSPPAAPPADPAKLPAPLAPLSPTR